MTDAELTTGWLVRVTTLTLDGKEKVQRNFIVAEPNASRAVQLAIEKIPVDHGEKVQAIGEPLEKDDLIAHKMKPGAVKQYA